jgi:hypothetical protein
MSHENLEAVREVISAVNDRDLDRYLVHCTESIQLETPWAAVEGVYEGPDAIRRLFSDLRDTLPDFHLVIERLEPIGSDRVLAFVRASATGRASGLPPGRVSSERPAAIFPARMSTTSPAERSDGSESSSTARKPSKPWACGSRRCRPEAVWSRLLRFMEGDSDDPRCWFTPDAAAPREPIAARRTPASRPEQERREAAWDGCFPHESGRGGVSRLTSRHRDTSPGGSYGTPGAGAAAKGARMQAECPQGVPLAGQQRAMRSAAGCTSNSSTSALTIRAPSSSSGPSSRKAPRVVRALQPS